MSAPLPGRAVGRRRRIVVGVDDGLDQRTLAIRYDVRIVCGDGDRGRRRHSCPSASSKAAPARDQAILCCSRRPPCCKYSGKIAAELTGACNSTLQRTPRAAG